MSAVRGALVTKLLVLVLFVGPVLLLVSGSFRDNQEMYRYAGGLSLWTVLPRAPTLDGYARALPGQARCSWLLRQVPVWATGTFPRGKVPHVRIETPMPGCFPREFPSAGGLRRAGASSSPGLVRLPALFLSRCGQVMRR